MKNNIFTKVVWVALIVISVLSCDTQNLRDLDIPKYLLTEDKVDFTWLYSNIIVSHSRRYIGGFPVRKEGHYLKYYATYSNLGLPGATNQFDRDINDNYWGISESNRGAYNSEIVMAKKLEDVLVKEDNPDMAYNLAIVRALKVASFQRLTDFYGDIPYSDAARLAIDGWEYSKPKYDSQEVIYDDMLKTLKEAAEVLNTPNAGAAAATWINGDLIYAGNVTKWKGFVNSLMLRLAMRISYVDATKAREYAELAIRNGVIVSNADNFNLPCSASTSPDERNTYGAWLAGEGGGDPERYIKLGEYFVNFLKDMNDPRMKIIFGGRLNPDVTAIVAADMSNYWRDVSKWNWDLTQALGMQHGTSTNPEPGIAEYHHKYTSPNPFLFRTTRPLELLTASEMLLLIAEAATNGWNTPGYTAESAYEAGIKANMSLLTGYGELIKSDVPSATQPNMDISASEMDAYIAAHSLGTGAAAKTRIAEEMWITMYMNPLEGWFNVRRMNLKLPVNNSTIPGFSMPRRNAYPENERSNNIDNLNEVLNAKGWDRLTREEEVQQRVWWDVNTN